MQIKALASFLFASVVVQAAPGTPVQERQATPTVYGQFFAGTACLQRLVDDIVFAQNTEDCIPNTITGGYDSISLTGNHLTRTLRVYSLPGCPVNQGNYFDLHPGNPDQCFAQKVGSARFL
ncbi:uncharacterized protein BDR25DRAFT_375748 [Lindgomyces ingoldianus]|uniref:Uncharacterized protein n=1 Tax=Lindgomyces ingoldianus TaxID=673940 RepID=A0ACB6RC80_9PLEO|nr:uncharacterized protein BDR25DRAFT_375748 [Lindgomyces ingoldianus]KAF2476702.1 hypothetical protein BDR25DRAFT_375748 [Lindgomyces ingoldianus]